MTRFSSRAICALVCAVLFLSVPLHDARAVSGIRDTEIERMMWEYATPILQAAGVPKNEVEIYLLSDPSINAFVTRGSSMYIHTGLLLEADRPAQVIGVLAHEIGHIAGGHVARMGDAFAAARTPMLVTMGLGLIAMAAGSPDAGMALLSSGQHIAERTILAHSRVQESAADQAAITYLERIGQSGRGLVEVTEKFRHMEVLSARNQNPYVRTHPLSSDRIQALTNRVEESPYADRRETRAQLFAFDMMQAKLYAFLNRPDLVFYKYPKSSMSQPARYARAIAYFRDPDIDAAVAEVKSLIEDYPDNPYFQELMGQILFESGRTAEAIPYHQRSVELMPDAPLLRINLAQAMLATEDISLNQSAIDHLRIAIRDEATNSFAWHQLAIAYAREENVGLANLATAERYFYNRRMPQAMGFAKRAQLTLDKGSPEWQRAADIMQVALLEQERNK